MRLTRFLAVILASTLQLSAQQTLVELTFPTLTELGAHTISTYQTNLTANVLGNAAIADGGASTWFFAPNSVAVVDGVTVIASTGVAGRWLIAPGAGTGGDVVGPFVSVDGNIATFDGITGKLIQDGGVAITNIANFATVDTIALLESYGGTAAFVAVTDTDRGGLFAYTTDALTADGGVVFAATGVGSGFWRRQYDGAVNVKWWNANGDGVTDDTAAIQAAIGASQTLNAEIYFPSGYYYCATSLNFTGPGTLGTNSWNAVLRGAGKPDKNRGWAGSENSRRSWIVGGDNGYPVMDFSGQRDVIIRDLGVSSKAGTYPQCGILLGRTAGDGDAGDHVLENVTVQGYYTQAGILTVSSECSRWTSVAASNTHTNGAGAYFSKSATNMFGTAVSRYQTVSLTGNGGQGVVYAENCTFYKSNLTGDKTGAALVLEYLQTALFESCYVWTDYVTNQIILGAMRPDVATPEPYEVMDNRSVTFIGLHEEFGPGTPADATGVWFRNNTGTGIRWFKDIKFIGSVLHRIYGDDLCYISGLRIESCLPSADSTTWLNVDRLYDSDISIGGTNRWHSGIAGSQSLSIRGVSYNNRFSGIDRNLLSIPPDAFLEANEPLAVNIPKGAQGLDNILGLQTGTFSGTYHSNLTAIGTSDYTLVSTFLCPPATTNSFKATVAALGNQAGCGARGMRIMVDKYGSLAVYDYVYDDATHYGWTVHTVTNFMQTFSNRWVTVSFGRDYGVGTMLTINAIPAPFTSTNYAVSANPPASYESKDFDKALITFCSFAGSGDSGGLTVNDPLRFGLVGKGLLTLKYLECDEIAEWINTGSRANLGTVTVDVDYITQAPSEVSINKLGTNHGTLAGPAVISGDRGLWGSVYNAFSAPTLSGASQVGLYSALDGSSKAQLYTVNSDGYVNQLSGNMGVGTNAPTAQLVVVSQGDEPAIVLENDAISAGTYTNILGGTRGAGAVDLQYGRNVSTKIASGVNSFIGGGTNNTASGSCSAVVGGSGNTASGYYSFVSGLSSASGGHNSFASGYYASSPLLGQFSTAYGRFAITGDAQMSILHAAKIMTIATSTVTNLYIDGVSATLTLPANTSWTFRADVVGRTTDAGTGDEESGAYTITGLIERDNAAANTRIVGTVTTTTIAEDDAAWDATASADTTNGALTITVTGNNETTIRWVATVYLTQVGG